jgi:hypothetical protein
VLHTTAVGGSSICTKDQRSVYIAQTNTIKLYDFFDGLSSNVISFTGTLNSNIIVANNILWWSTLEETNDEQLLYHYNIATGVTTTTIIPTRVQTSAKRYLNFDFNGHILVTAYNTHSISKFSNTGTYIGTYLNNDSVSGLNKEPNFIFTSQDKTAYIGSYKGMISTFDTTTNVVSHFGYGLNNIKGFMDLDNYIWFCTGTILGRMTKSNKHLNYSGIPTIVDADDPAFPPTNLSIITETTGCDRLIITPNIDTTKWNGSAIVSTTINNFIFCIQGSSLFAVEATALYRTPYYEVSGHSMISKGQHDYIGE